MTINQLIDRYQIKIVMKDGQEMLHVPCKPNAADVAELKAQKANIIAELHRRENEKREAAEQRKVRIEAIEGLNQIKQAQEMLAEWHRNFNAAMNKGDGILPNKPEITESDIENMMNQYPVAAAYIRAEELASKCNYELASIGAKALEQIIAGQDAVTVMSNMDAERKEFTDRHLWD